MQRITFTVETNAACKSSFKHLANYTLYAVQWTHTRRDSERHSTSLTRKAAAKVIMAFDLLIVSSILSHKCLYCALSADRIKIDVSTSTLLESSHKTSSVAAAAAAAAAAATDYQQPVATGDELPAGTAQPVTYNGTEVKVDVNTDAGGVQLSDEDGGM